MAEKDDQITPNQSSYAPAPDLSIGSPAYRRAVRVMFAHLAFLASPEEAAGLPARVTVDAGPGPQVGHSSVETDPTTVDAISPEDGHRKSISTSHSQDEVVDAPPTASIRRCVECRKAWSNPRSPICSDCAARR